MGIRKWSGRSTCLKGCCHACRRARIRPLGPRRDRGGNSSPGGRGTAGQGGGRVAERDRHRRRRLHAGRAEAVPGRRVAGRVRRRARRTRRRPRPRGPAAVTHRIKLGTAVTVLSTDDPIRVFQQLATAASLAPGRIELVAGRGSSTITFPLFDQDERDYDMLYASKLDLLMAVNAGENITWQGPHRKRPLQNVTVFPRPEEPLTIWLGTGGSPHSVGRAVELGLPMFLGVLGGTPAHWSRYGHAYRDAWTASGHPAEESAIAVAVHGFVAESGARARSTYLEHDHRMMAEGLAELGRPAPSRADRAANHGPDGMVFVGGPDEIADRVLHLHGLLGHTRQILHMDVGGMPQRDFLHGIELLGTKVLPQLRAALANP
ncbi:LLM class flavin-dependent oxidoreductase [Streptomyces deccanensis]|nr:LLM class flavin-dependent oxidoreductase [Streptomyces deccanensis]ULR55669.1 LLM class flavin-dependent oxidoreductase [Streptomyces deccanensis]